jgi:hypothetical protein
MTRFHVIAVALSSTLKVLESDRCILFDYVFLRPDLTTVIDIQYRYLNKTRTASVDPHARI